MRSSKILIRMAGFAPRISFASACILLIIATGCSHRQALKQGKQWNPKAAAAYLDKREDQWSGWGGAARDHGTFCVSCHTALPYALARPVLAKSLSETNVPAQEKQLINNVVRRVRLWDETDPYYSDKDSGLYKTFESRGTEAVLNALILVTRGAQQQNFSSDTRSAFDHVWAVQETSGETRGSWPWLAFGHEEPWEADDSRYYGACLAAVAIGKAPKEYQTDPKVQPRIDLLRDYLKRVYSQESLINRVALLWSSTELPGVIDPQQRKLLVDEILSKQQADGGWQLAPLAWKWRGLTLASFSRTWLRSDGSLVDRHSDAYATALIAFVLPRAGVSARNPQLQKAMLWLANHQTDEGYWLSHSINKRRSLSSNAGRFMSDAATAYAVLALTNNGFEGHTMATKHDLHSSTNAQDPY